MTQEPKHSWFTWEKIAAALGVLVIVGNMIISYSGTAFKADTLALTLATTKADNVAAMVGLNARLDRLFEKVDTINERLPVLVERLDAARGQIAEGKGAYGSLESRLRAIETNVEAVHQESIKPRRN